MANPAEREIVISTSVQKIGSGGKLSSPSRSPTTQSGMAYYKDNLGSSQLPGLCKLSSQNENNTFHDEHMPPPNQQPSAVVGYGIESQQHGFCLDHHLLVLPQKAGAQCFSPSSTQQGPKLCDKSHMVNRKALSSEVPFVKMLPYLFSHLSKDKVMQLNSVFSKLAKNEVNRDTFLKAVRRIAGTQLLKEATYKFAMETFSSPSFGYSKPCQQASVSLTKQSQVKYGSLSTSLPLERSSIMKKRGSIPPSSPAISKKQKVFEPCENQNTACYDMIAESGVDLMEEKEQILYGHTKIINASKENRRISQKRLLILEKGSLLKKIDKIMSNCGIKRMSKDVEHCLSVCVEARIRQLITNMIKVSKQRIGNEKLRHRNSTTSNVLREILTLNVKAKEDEKNRCTKEHKKAGQKSVIYVTKDMGDEGPKPSMYTLEAKKQESYWQTIAANNAVRAAIGGHDMQSRFQRLYDRASKKNGGDQNGQSNSHDSHGCSSVTMRSSGVTIKVKPVRPLQCSISVKDVIAVLQREPQMSKSILLHQLYARTPF